MARLFIAFQLHLPFAFKYGEITCWDKLPIMPFVVIIMILRFALTLKYQSKFN